jgi:rhodanese-related sulfurtransferase
LADWSPTISADELYENLNDGDDSNDPFIVSVRSAEHYALGHIPGAYNIPWKTIADPDSLAKLPTDQQIVLYCYTGHTGQVATTLLRTFGYDAVNLKFGMMGWTDNDNILVAGRYAAAAGYPTETEANELTETYDPPVLETGETDAIAIAQARAQAFLADWSPTIAADDLYENLNDGDDSNDPFIVSVRSAEHYALGHVPGAGNIPWKEIADPESLVTLPTDQQIVVYCYTGHTGQVAATTLALLGYDVTNLKFGMMGWTDDDDVLAIARYTGAPGYPTESDIAEFETLANHIAERLADWSPTIAADDLYENLNDGDDSNDPFIVSVRSAEHYALGHIPGAYNIPWKTIADPANLAKLPTDQQIVLYCYTGHTGQVATTLLRTFGYDAVNLKFGMMGWTDDDDILVAGRYAAAAGYPTETEANELTETYDPPVLETGETDAIAIAQARAQAFLADWSPTIAADALYENLNDGDDSNDPFIVSVRSAEHYTLGHVPGAGNIPWKEIANLDNLAKLPTDQQIVVYCYTGHTGQVAATTLALLGYDVTNLKFGMMGWTDDDEVLVAGRYAGAPGYPTEAGAADVSFLENAAAYFGEGFKLIGADALYENLNDGDDSNDPVILDIRKAEDYAVGHVTGAVNMSGGAVFSDETLAALPTDEQVVVYCYTGQSAGQVVGALNTLGYDAYSLKFGMPSWAIAEGASRWNESMSMGYPADTEAVEMAGENELPTPLGSAFEYFGEGVKLIGADALYENLNDGDDSNDPYIIDIRSGDDYALGHVPGAVNVSGGALFAADKLDDLPTDGQVVIYCYSGQTAGQVTAVLNMLGYDAYSLKFGYPGWTLENVSSGLWDDGISMGYPMDTEAHELP